MSDMDIRDYDIAIPQGTLFARSWRPEEARAASKVPILLLHDSLGSVELWREFPEQLARGTGRRVLAYDRLGFGRSTPYPGTIPFSFIGDEAEINLPLLQEQMGFGRFIPFGHSVGGGMAIMMAARYKEDCAALITEAAQSFTDKEIFGGLHRARELFRDPEQFARLKRYHGEKAGWVLSSWIDTWLSPPFENWTLAGELAKIEIPVLALHGDHDEYGATEHARRISTGTAGPARMVIIEDCGHVPHRERAEAVLETVKAFLADVP